MSHLRKNYGIESLRRNEEEEDASMKKISTKAKNACLPGCSGCSLVPLVRWLSVLVARGDGRKKSCPEAPGSIHGKQGTITYKRTPIQIQAGLSA